jgi:hypothetical protein
VINDTVCNTRNAYIRSGIQLYSDKPSPRGLGDFGVLAVEMAGSSGQEIATWNTSGPTM